MKIYIFISVFLFCVIRFSISSSSNSDLLINSKLSEFQKNNEINDDLLKKLEIIIHHYIKTKSKNLKTELKEDSFICKTCGSFFDLLLKTEFPLVGKILWFLSIEICSIAGIFDYEVCKGAVTEMTPIVLDSIKFRMLDKDRICPSLYLCPAKYKNVSIRELREIILKDKPIWKNFNFNLNPGKKSNNTLKILHITDLHTDLEYIEGAIADCNEPLCCREESKSTKTSTKKSGKWGTLADCDIPEKTLRKTIDFINENLNIDIGIWTGDNTSHDIWHQTFERNLENTKFITDLFMNKFNFTVYPSIGNHESYPVNIYDFKSTRENKFNEFFSKEWDKWIGSSASKIMLKDGYYSSYNEKLNLKVISLNSQTCNNENFYLIKDPTDPGNMLTWLRSELYLSEEFNQNVYIINHYPNVECVEDFSEIFDAIVDRFELTIKGIFVGHNHGDGYSVIRDSKNQNIVGISLMAPSFTTYSNRNPSFRVIEVDQETMRPINVLQYRLNMNKANNSTSDDLPWELAYDYLSEYNMKDFSFESIAELTQKLIDNEEIIKKFKKNFEAGSVSDSNSIKTKSNTKFKNMGENYFFCMSFNTPAQARKCLNEKEGLFEWVMDYVRGSWRIKIK